MKQRNHTYNSAFTDLLFNILIGYAVLLIFAILLINPVTKVVDANVKKEADYFIELTWPETINCDVDLWIQDPLDNVVFFGAKDKGLSNLERDDIGSNTDRVLTPSGAVVVRENKEIMTIRGAIPGNYTVNTHLYACRELNGITKLDMGTEIEVPVTVKLVRINPTYQEEYKVAYTHKRIWDEFTAFSFEMTPQKNAIRFTTDQIGLVDDNLKRVGP